MSVDVIMPKLGESITEGTILEWKKNVGDDISKDETLLEISTDKVDSEIPSPSEGKVIEIIYKVNDVVEVGKVIARIGSSSEINTFKETIKKTKTDNNLDQEDTSNFKENKSNQIKEQKNITISINKRFYSPLVKSIAIKENISLVELDNIKGSGNNDRVNKHDLLKHLENRVNLDSESNLNSKLSSIEYHLENKTEPMGHVRKMISNHMIKSKETSVHVYSTSEIDMSNIVQFRNNNKEIFKSKHGTPLTYTPFIIDAVIKSIQKHPLMNACVQNDNIKYNQNINIGVAVALQDDNLIVPVIKKSEELNFLGITRSTYDLSTKARNGSLSPDDVIGSTFTITNPGIFGSLFGMGIINQPNVGLLSVGSIHKKPVVKETDVGDVIIIRSMMYATLAYDHRLIDGAYGTKFLSTIKENLESFSSETI